MNYHSRFCSSQSPYSPYLFALIFITFLFLEKNGQSLHSQRQECFAVTLNINFVLKKNPKRLIFIRYCGRLVSFKTLNLFYEMQIYYFIGDSKKYTVCSV